MQFNFFSFFKDFTKPTETFMAKINKLPNGRFGLVDRGGIMIADYARRRDAVRGATRRGLAIA